MRSPFVAPVEVRDVSTGTRYWLVQDDDRTIGVIDKFPYRRDGIGRVMCWCDAGQQAAEDRIDGDDLGPGCIHEEEFTRWQNRPPSAVGISGERTYGISSGLYE